ncbi:MAG: extracellular solute-binding protein, partial [Firmicutes bacterium]|nr:extracellular solute-binding protein [Bacillota bacterium]
LYTVAAFVQNPKYGWDFLKALKANGIKLVQGSSDSVTKVGSGEWDVSIAVDYIAKDAERAGSPVGFVYPASGASVVASPIAIIKGTKNLEAAKILYDYILSLEGQNVLVKANTIPIRPEIKLEDVSVERLLATALPVDDARLVAEKDDMLDRFGQLMKK